MWFTKFVLVILLFPWSLIFLVVAASVRRRSARKALGASPPPSSLRPVPVISPPLPDPGASRSSRPSVSSPPGL